MKTRVDDYLAKLPATQRQALNALRALLHSQVPGAVETIKTRVPAICYKGKTVVGFGAGARHVALYVMFGDALRVLKPELTGFDATTRVVRYAPDAPLPDALVEQVVRIRLAEIDMQTDRAGSKAARLRRRSRSRVP